MAGRHPGRAGGRPVAGGLAMIPAPTAAVFCGIAGALVTGALDTALAFPDAGYGAGVAATSLRTRHLLSHGDHLTAGAGARPLARASRITWMTSPGRTVPIRGSIWMIP